MKLKTLCMLVVSIGAVVWFVPSCTIRTGVTAEELTKAINEKLPPGTNEAVVEAFLDSYHIKHGNYKEQHEIKAIAHDTCWNIVYSCKGSSQNLF